MANKKIKSENMDKFSGIGIGFILGIFFYVIGLIFVYTSSESCGVAQTGFWRLCVPSTTEISIMQMIIFGIVGGIIGYLSKK